MKQKYINFFKEAEESNEHWTEIAISDFTDEICRLMDEYNISRAELADRIDSSPAYITKVLRGNVNFTLATMTKLARALGAVVRVHLAPDNVIVRWYDKPIETTSINIPWDSFPEGKEFLTFESRQSPRIDNHQNVQLNPEVCALAA